MDYSHRVNCFNLTVIVTCQEEIELYTQPSFHTHLSFLLFDLNCIGLNLD